MNPSVTSLSDGGFVVTWQSTGQDGSDRGVYGQRYDAAGEALGDKFRINTRTVNEQMRPVVTSLSNGDFVVAWQSSNQDGDNWGVYGQRLGRLTRP